MTIEIHQPKLEALIHQRMSGGRFQSVEDLLLQALKAMPEEPAKHVRQNFLQLIQKSSLWVQVSQSNGRKTSLGQ